MNPYCQLARQAIHHWLAFEKRLPNIPTYGQQAACFVSLYRQGHQLRGCIGTLSANQSDLAYEIAENAIGAATRDPRFSPLTLAELAHVRFEVSILYEPEPIPNDSFLDPARYGIIVAADTRRGVLLPGIDGITSVQDQIRIAKRKAQIGPEEAVSLSRFEVISHRE